MSHDLPVDCADMAQQVKLVKEAGQKPAGFGQGLMGYHERMGRIWSSEMC